MAAKGHKVISFAFKEIKLEDLNQLINSCPIESDDFRQQIECDLIYLATFGLADPLRKGVSDVIQTLKYGSSVVSHKQSPQVNIRMITGDHLETAKAVALESGIVT
jgi:Ca2+-transporting ATPase